MSPSIILYIQVYHVQAILYVWEETHETYVAVVHSAILFLLLSIWSITDRSKWLWRVALLQKYVTYSINTIQMFKAFPLVERHFRALAPKPLFCASGRWFRFSSRALSMEKIKLHDWGKENRERQRWEEVGQGFGPCLEACGWLCWFTACQHWSLLNSGDKCSQMLWPYYGKEVCWVH